MRAITVSFPQDLRKALIPLLPAEVPLLINEIDVGNVRIEQKNGGVVVIPDERAITIFERMMK